MSLVFAHFFSCQKYHFSPHPSCHSPLTYRALLSCNLLSETISGQVPLSELAAILLTFRVPLGWCTIPYSAEMSQVIDCALGLGGDWILWLYSLFWVTSLHAPQNLETGKSLLGKETNIYCLTTMYEVLRELHKISRKISVHFKLIIQLGWQNRASKNISEQCQATSGKRQEGWFQGPKY